MFHRLSAIAATAVICWPVASSGQSVTPPKHTRVFGAYSVNADYVENVPFAIIVDQPVSPFLSLGSGPFGFEARSSVGCAGASA